MKPNELSELNEFQLVDVRLEEDYEASHLPGAVNNCVFEVTFVERLSKTAPDPSLPTIVYGANAESREASIAAEKMKQAGYTDVRILEGGLETAHQQGVDTNTGTPVSEPGIKDGRHLINLEESRFEWLGRNLINKHFGTAPIESGHLDFKDGNLVSGKFVVDLERLTCTDLENSQLHDVLIAHLKDDDFFDVQNHPKAVFVVTGSTPIAERSPGSPNLLVSGNLTLRGQAHPVQFEAAAGVTPEGFPAAQASFSIDRTQWGVLYGSGKLFHRLAGHLVNDLIEFQIKIVTR